MKIKQILAVLAGLLIAVSVCFSQPIPTGPTVAMPRVENGSYKLTICWTDHLQWPKLFRLDAVLGEVGVREMVFMGGSADQGTDFEFTYPGKGGDTLFKKDDIAKWTELVMKISKQYVLRDNVCIETEAYLPLGVSITLDADGQSTMDLESYVFNRNGRLLAVPSQNWVGSSPKIGVPVVIGYSLQSEGRLFFSAKVDSDGMYRYPEKALKDAIAKNSK